MKVYQHLDLPFVLRSPDFLRLLDKVRASQAWCPTTPGGRTWSSFSVNLERAEGVSCQNIRNLMEKYGGATQLQFKDVIFDGVWCVFTCEFEVQPRRRFRGEQCIVVIVWLVWWSQTIVVYLSDCAGGVVERNVVCRHYRSCPLLFCWDHSTQFKQVFTEKRNIWGINSWAIPSKRDSHWPDDEPFLMARRLMVEKFSQLGAQTPNQLSQRLQATDLHAEKKTTFADVGNAM